ncbi:MAG: sigma-70 family RNA polymerase sigma factor [Bacteroides sp.]|nr:sigma-70 family RNA polymerase sigma factor [Bacteroides sp.]
MKIDDGKSIEQIVKEYRPKLSSFIRKRIPGKEDAEDIMQEVFYQFFKTVEVRAVQIVMVSAWMYRTAANMIFNFSKKKRETGLPGYCDDEDGMSLADEFTATLFDDDNPTPETEYLRSLVWEELEAALSELPPAQREIFEMTEMEGIPVKEISEISGIPVNTLLSRKHYAVKHLRKRLGELYMEILDY